jgi:hypothetical protein
LKFEPISTSGDDPPEILAVMGNNNGAQVTPNIADKNTSNAVNYESELR